MLAGLPGIVIDYLTFTIEMEIKLPRTRNYRQLVPRLDSQTQWGESSRDLWLWQAQEEQAEGTSSLIKSRLDQLENIHSATRIRQTRYLQ